MSNYDNALDVQVGGNHYKDVAIQPIEFVTANGLGFCEANIVKYSTRYKAKGGVQDLRKVEHYIQLHMETIKSEPWLLRQLRIFWQTKGYSEGAITPNEYLDANLITNEHQRHLIFGVCYWRKIDGHHIYSLDSMLQAVRSLIAEEMVGENYGK